MFHRKNRISLVTQNIIWKTCAGIHLALFLVAIIWLMPSGSVAHIIDQLDETMEFIFSPNPLRNYFEDAAARTAMDKLFLIFAGTALPGYIIGFSLFSRYFDKRD